MAATELARAVAIIMDGNGRWAEQRGLPVAEGHRAGTKALRRTVEAAIDLGVESLAVYAFSTENWARSPGEVKGPVNTANSPNRSSPLDSQKSVCSVCQLHAESTFRIEGMDCREEVALIERRFKNLNGIEDFSADLMGQRLHVKYDAAKLTTSAMVEAVGQTGMRMWLEHEEPRADSVDIRWRLYLMAASGAATFMPRSRHGPSFEPPWHCSR